MANTAIKFGAIFGLASGVTGLAMQMTTFPALQDAGYLATLTGLASTCVAGGFGLASQSWKQYRREVHVLADLSEFEMEIGQGLDTSSKDLEAYMALAKRGGDVFESADNEKLSDLVYRMQKVGRELARQMPVQKDAEVAIEVVIATMNSLRSDVGFIGAFADTPLQLSRNTTYVEPLPSQEWTGTPLVQNNTAMLQSISEPAPRPSASMQP